MASKRGFYWRNRDIQDMNTSIRRKVTDPQKKALKQMLEDIAETGAEEMREIIRTVESSLVPGKIGRIASGTMIESVGTEPVKVSDDYLSVKWGWTDEQLKYFLWQEDGTGSPLNISPMHALLGSFLTAREELRSRLSKEF